MQRSLGQSQLNKIYSNLKKANSNVAEYYPGESEERQPVHTVYGGANLFKSSLVSKLGDIAVKALDTYGKNFVHFAKLLGLKGSKTLPDSPNKIESLAKKTQEEPKKTRIENKVAWLAYNVYSRVREKLLEEPIEDFRIDFEDGYGYRPSEEEDRHAVQAAEQLAEGMQKDVLPPYIGIRIKPFTEELKERSIRTLDIFMTKLNELTDSKLPDNFVVTLPKVATSEQIKGAINILEVIERETRFKKAQSS